MGIYIHRVFAWVEWFFPNTFLTLLYNITMLKAVAAGVLAFRTNKGVDHTYITDRDINHVHLFNQYKPWVEVIGTGKDHIFLQTFSTAGVDERDRVLEVFMTFNRAACYFAFVQRLPVQGRNDTHFVFLHLCNRHHFNFKKEVVDTIATRR